MQDRNSFFCPVPGYDRHFKLCEEFAINMIPISLTGKGPNIEEIKLNCKNDSSIKGIWCVPKHSNPTGETYSEDCIKGLLEIEFFLAQSIFSNLFILPPNSSIK